MKEEFVINPKRLLPGFLLIGILIYLFYLLLKQSLNKLFIDPNAPVHIFMSSLALVLLMRWLWIYFIPKISIDTVMRIIKLRRSFGWETIPMASIKNISVEKVWKTHRRIYDNDYLRINLLNGKTLFYSITWIKNVDSLKKLITNLGIETRETVKPEQKDPSKINAYGHFEEPWTYIKADIFV